eukprot:7389666-Prymnesium_polylepis.1
MSSASVTRRRGMIEERCRPAAPSCRRPACELRGDEPGRSPSPSAPGTAGSWSTISDFDRIISTSSGASTRKELDGLEERLGWAGGEDARRPNGDCDGDCEANLPDLAIPPTALDCLLKLLPAGCSDGESCIAGSTALHVEPRRGGLANFCLRPALTRIGAAVPGRQSLAVQLWWRAHTGAVGARRRAPRVVLRDSWTSLVVRRGDARRPPRAWAWRRFVNKSRLGRSEKLWSMTSSLRDESQSMLSVTALLRRLRRALQQQLQLRVRLSTLVHELDVVRLDALVTCLQLDEASLGGK